METGLAASTRIFSFKATLCNNFTIKKQLQNYFGGTLTCYLTLVDRVRHLSQELHNALWHHLTQQQLDPSRLSLYGHHGAGDEDTKEDVVGGSEEEKKRAEPSKRPNKSRAGF